MTTPQSAQSPVWERVDKVWANIQRNQPQPTGVRWNDPVAEQDPPWLVGEEGQEDPTCPVEWAWYPEGDTAIRVRSREAPPFGQWRQVEE